MSSLLKRIGIATACGVVGLGLGAGSASAAKVKNGDFETGTLAGWQQDFFGPGEWFAHEGPYFGEKVVLPRGTEAPLVPGPPQGQFAAITGQEGRSAQILSQVVKLRGDKKHALRFKLAYTNQNRGPVVLPRGMGFGPGFFTPNHLRFSGAARPNQQLRVDVVKPGAPIKSLKKKHVLKRVYRTNRGDANRRAYRTVKANLTSYAGKKVRLRFAVVVTEDQLNVGIDAVRVKTTRR